MHHSTSLDKTAPAPMVQKLRGMPVRAQRYASASSSARPRVVIDGANLVRAHASPSVDRAHSALEATTSNTTAVPFTPMRRTRVEVRLPRACSPAAMCSPAVLYNSPAQTADPIQRGLCYPNLTGVALWTCARSALQLHSASALIRRRHGHRTFRRCRGGGRDSGGRTGEVRCCIPSAKHGRGPAVVRHWR